MKKIWLILIGIMTSCLGLEVCHIPIWMEDGRGDKEMHRVIDTICLDGYLYLTKIPTKDPNGSTALVDLQPIVVHREYELVTRSESVVIQKTCSCPGTIDRNLPDPIKVRR